uniref:Uncharacterized protein n=1 Tax=Oryza rufipogon TaxID=4529 RepID=A0A0E0NJ99_ORYRU
MSSGVGRGRWDHRRRRFSARLLISGQSVTLSVCHHPGGPVPIAMHACLAINPAAAVQYTYQVVRIIHPTNLTPVFGVSY